MDIFVKYPDDETLHHYRTGDGEGSDPTTFRATTLGGRTDLVLTDADGNVLDAPSPALEVVSESVKKRKAAATK